MREDGLATKLLDRFREIVQPEVSRSKQFPKQANQMSGRLRRLIPALRQIGIEVKITHTEDGSNIVIAKKT